MRIKKGYPRIDLYRFGDFFCSVESNWFSMGIPKISGERHQGCIQGKPEKVDDTVEGYNMEEVQAKDESTDLASSWVQWFASIFIFMILGLVVFGMIRQKRSS